MLFCWNLQPPISFFPKALKAYLQITSLKVGSDTLPLQNAWQQSCSSFCMILLLNIYCSTLREAPIWAKYKPPGHW